VGGKKFRIGGGYPIKKKKKNEREIRQRAHSRCLKKTKRSKEGFRRSPLEGKGKVPILRGQPRIRRGQGVIILEEQEKGGVWERVENA